ncbi:MAG TPA: hypothetical protein VL240_08750 [Candidatus Binatia bacterium]|nr:hypothetical protein [Candidatus Binatia bacterium]
MKFARFLVVLAMTSLPVMSLPAIGQQEIDPEHFDQPVPAKTTQAAKQPKASPKAAALKNQQKSISKATNGSRISPRPRQVKAENQRIASVNSTGE